MAAAAAGEPLAWNQLIDRYAVLIRSVCRAHRLCDADADDVAQLTWLRAVEHIGRLRDPRPLRRLGRHDRAPRVPGGPARAQARRPDRGRGAAAAVRRRTSTRRRPSSPRSAATRCGRRWARCRPASGRSCACSTPTPSRATTTIGSALGMPVGSIGPTRGRALERLRQRTPTRAPLSRIGFGIHEHGRPGRRRRPLPLGRRIPGDAVPRRGRLAAPRRGLARAPRPRLERVGRLDHRGRARARVAAAGRRRASRMRSSRRCARWPGAPSTSRR